MVEQLGLVCYDAGNETGSLVQFFFFCTSFLTRYFFLCWGSLFGQRTSAVRSFWPPCDIFRGPSSLLHSGKKKKDRAGSAMDLRRLPSTRLFKLCPQLPFAIIPQKKSEEDDSLIEKTDWEPGCSDIRLPELRTESATFDYASSDNGQACKPSGTQLDVPDLVSYSRLFVVLFVLSATLSSTAMVLALLDAPFAPHRAVDTLPEYRRTVAIRDQRDALLPLDRDAERDKLLAEKATDAKELATQTGSTRFPGANLATEPLQNDWDLLPNDDSASPRNENKSTTHER